MITKKLIFILCFCFAPLSFALSPIEKQIQSNVIQLKSAQIKTLEQLVNINSGTNNLPGIYRVGHIVENEFQKLGFKTEWVKLPAAMKRASTLVAKRTGKGKKILLIGHLDTVFAADSPFQRFSIQGRTAYGPGVIDDKGGVVVMLYALKALAAANALEKTAITVVLTGDEEDSGKPSAISRKPLIQAAKNVDVALDFEPGTEETVSLARRGVSNWSIKVTGNESHSAAIFQKDVGAGAIFELARILNSARTNITLGDNLTFNPGIVVAGTQANLQHNGQGKAFGKQNVVAKTAVAQGDIRFSTLKEQQLLEKKLTSIVNQHLPGTTATISFIDGIPSMPVTPDSRQLLKTFSDISVQVGAGEITEYPASKRGAGDISHVAAIVPAKLVGLGPIGDGMHSVYETLNLDSLPIQTQRVAILIYRLTH